MRSYEFMYVVNGAVGTDNIKYLPDEREQRVKLLDNIKAVAKAVFDKHLSTDYGKFEDFWAATKQLDVKESDFETGGEFNINELMRERKLHEDTCTIGADLIGEKFATMQVLKLAYEQVSVGEYAYGAMLIPEEKTMGFVVYLKRGQGKYIGIITRYCDFYRLDHDECFGCAMGNGMGAFGGGFGGMNMGGSNRNEDWDYACLVGTLSNVLEV